MQQVWAGCCAKQETNSHPQLGSVAPEDSSGPLSGRDCISAASTLAYPGRGPFNSHRSGIQFSLGLLKASRYPVTPDPPSASLAHKTSRTSRAMKKKPIHLPFSKTVDTFHHRCVALAAATPAAVIAPLSHSPEGAAIISASPVPQTSPCRSSSDSADC